MASLADQADHSPAFFPLLQMPEFEIRQLTPTQPEPEQTAKIARSRLPFSVSASGACQQPASFFGCKPVPQPDTQLS